MRDFINVENFIIDVGWLPHSLMMDGFDVFMLKIIWIRINMTRVKIYYLALFFYFFVLASMIFNLIFYIFMVQVTK